jgi:hypothetical protein
MKGRSVRLRMSKAHTEASMVEGSRQVTENTVVKRHIHVVGRDLDYLKLPRLGGQSPPVEIGRSQNAW